MRGMVSEEQVLGLLKERADICYTRGFLKGLFLGLLVGAGSVVVIYAAFF